MEKTTAVYNPNTAAREAEEFAERLEKFARMARRAGAYLGEGRSTAPAGRELLRETLRGLDMARERLVTEELGE